MERIFELIYTTTITAPDVLTVKGTINIKRKFFGKNNKVIVWYTPIYEYLYSSNEPITGMDRSIAEETVRDKLSDVIGTLNDINSGS